MQVTTRVILWITLIHFFVFTIVFTYYKTDSLHSYKTGKIQGLNAGDSQENRLLAEIAFKNLEAFEDKDILRELDAYANIEYFNFVEYQQDWNYVPGFKFAKNPDYCYKVDWYNLKNFDNIFTEQNFFTDYHEGYVRTEVIDKVGEVHMAHFKSTDEEFRIDYKINNFFVNSTEFHFDHFIGKDFLCSTQMYNRIPGNEFLTRKDLGLDRFLEYSAKYNERKQCGLPSAPKSYRLYHADECKAFFGIINSPEYITSSKSNPIQYLTKVGYNSHESTGVELFTENQRAQLRNAFHGGLECGVFEAALIAQSYISNPLLLNLNNKFDLKVYMLIASVNPLIVYYHDGYLRAAMKEYDIESIDEGVHLVNPQLIRKQIQEIHEWNANDISVEELIEYHLWNFQDFEDFLFDTGKIANKGWLENILKPDLKRAMIHLTKMVKDELLKEPNVYHLLELDFMLDADLNLWYIEANSHPQLHQESPKVAKMITEMLLDLFDIQYAYYRARMKRLVGVLAMIERDMKDNGYVDFASWQGEYRRAVKNHFDPEYPIKENNSFELIMDENKKGVDAYLGLLSEECI